MYASKEEAQNDFPLFKYSLGWRPSVDISDAVTCSLPQSLKWDSIPGLLWNNLRTALIGGQVVDSTTQNRKRLSDLSTHKPKTKRPMQSKREEEDEENIENKENIEEETQVAKITPVPPKVPRIFKKNLALSSTRSQSDYAKECHAAAIAMTANQPPGAIAKILSKFYASADDISTAASNALTNFKNALYNVTDRSLFIQLSSILFPISKKDFEFITGRQVTKNRFTAMVWHFTIYGPGQPITSRLPTRRGINDFVTAVIDFVSWLVKWGEKTASIVARVLQVTKEVVFIPLMFRDRSTTALINMYISERGENKNFNNEKMRDCV
jgi:hypothetical protein